MWVCMNLEKGLWYRNMGHTYLIIKYYNKINNISRILKYIIKIIVNIVHFFLKVLKVEHDHLKSKYLLLYKYQYFFIINKP